MAQFATQPISKQASPFRNHPAGFEMGQPDSRQMKDNGQLKTGWLAGFKISHPADPSCNARAIVACFQVGLAAGQSVH